MNPIVSRAALTYRTGCTHYMCVYDQHDVLLFVVILLPIRTIGFRFSPALRDVRKAYTHEGAYVFYNNNTDVSIVNASFYIIIKRTVIW